MELLVIDSYNYRLTKNYYYLECQKLIGKKGKEKRNVTLTI